MEQQTQTPFKIVLNPGRVKIGKMRRRVFVTVEYRANRHGKMALSITGVQGPMPSGNAYGSCGQIIMSNPELVDVGQCAPGWSRPMVAKLAQVWERWHLNDMRAGTPAQMEVLQAAKDGTHKSDYYSWALETLTAAGLNPDGGYTYGSAWLHEDVPAEIVAWLRALPPTTVTPAWH